MFYQNPSKSWWYTLNVEINATMDTSETHKEANWKKSCLKITLISWRMLLIVED